MCCLQLGTGSSLTPSQMLVDKRKVIDAYKHCLSNHKALKGPGKPVKWGLTFTSRLREKTVAIVSRRSRWQAEIEQENSTCSV